MNSTDIAKAIKYLKPTAEFSFQETDYSTIKWDVLEGDAPTWAELEVAHQSIKAAEAQAQATAKAQKQAILDRLGLTEDELRIVLG